MAAIDCEVLELGDFPLASGEVPRGGRLTYATYGMLNAVRDNCVVVPTYYTGTNRSNARIVAAGAVVRRVLGSESREIPMRGACTAAAGFVRERPPQR
jgi:homoserine acetyltransferase